MKKRIEFYKEDGTWYADVPNHTKAENRMVAGADKFLDNLASGKNHVKMFVGDEDLHGDYMFQLNRIHHDKYGGTYRIKGYGLKFLWLCNVTHDVIGEHWKKIYIYTINC